MSPLLPPGLLIATETGETLFVKDLVALSGESHASALRRLDRLQASALIERHIDSDDHRRFRVRLTARGYQAMTAMLGHLYDDVTPSAPDHGRPTSFRPHPLC